MHSDKNLSEGKGLSRRSFLGVGAAAALTAGAALTGCTPRTVTDSDATEADGATTGSQGLAANDTYTPSFLQIPDQIPEGSIKQTYEVEIAIIGLGLSGLCAARAAAEAGAKSIMVVEKAEQYQYRSNQFAMIGGPVQEHAGISVDKQNIVRDLMKGSGYRANQRILNQWANWSGEAFSWFLAPCGDEYTIEDEAEPYDGKSLSVRQHRWPHPTTLDASEDYCASFDVCAITLPDMGPYLEKSYQACVAMGVQFRYSTWARQLIKSEEKDRVEGVVIEDLTGAYHRIIASKAVLLATGDYSSNSEMMGYYVPWATRFENTFPNTDAQGEKTNTGDGQRMGMWAGAKMEAGPHASIVHHVGGPLGVDGFLLVDDSGARFTNEDISGQALQNQISRLPNKTAWQIFDAKWKDEIGSMASGFASVNWFREEAKDVPNGMYEKNASIALATNEDGKTPGFDTYFSEESPGFVANSIKELATKMDVKVRTLENTIARYNELADAENDEDFSKCSDRLFPIVEAPFYAYKLTDTKLHATLGGLITNTDFQVLDTEDKVIEGLYAVGNVQGGRFSVDYPITTPGISHGMALTHGMLVGRELASLADKTTSVEESEEEAS